MRQMDHYNEVFNNLSYTSEQKTKIAAKAASAAISAPNTSHRIPRSLGKLAATAACFLFLLTITAEAAGISTPVSHILAPIFGGSVAQTEVIDKIGHPIDASDTDNGITIRAEAIIGDEYNACLVFSIQRDDGTPLLPEGITAGQLLLGGYSDIELLRNGGTHGSSRFIDSTPGDHEIQYIRIISANKPLNNGICTVTFGDLCYWDEASGTPKPVLEGMWKFCFEVDFEDSSIVFGNEDTFRQDDMNFTITEIRLSPIAVQVHYVVDSEVQWTNAPSGRLPDEDRIQAQRYMENVQILLQKKDGTTMDMSNAGGSITPVDGKSYCIKGGLFSEIIPLEELESISVGGIVFPLD